MLTQTEREWFLSQDERYAEWIGALDGKPIVATEGDVVPGYYRSRSRSKSTGQVSFRPVALWYDGKTLRCIIDGEEVEEKKARFLWPYLHNKPIPPSTYKFYTDNGHWPDQDQVAALLLQDDDSPSLEALGPRIAELVKQADTYQAIPDEITLTKAQSVRDALLKAKRDAESGCEEECRPYKEAYDSYRKITVKWNSLAKTAENTAKLLRERMQVAVTTMRRQAQEVAEALAASKDDWRAGDGAPPVGHNAPAPSAEPVPTTRQIKGSSGRAASASITYTAEIEDWDAVYQHFKAEPAVRNVLYALASSATKRGETIPGVKRVEGTMIR